MNRLVSAATIALMISVAAFAQPAAALELARTLASLPADSVTVTKYYNRTSMIIRHQNRRDRGCSHR